jgi:DNA-binding GntR family transcriptional regulator
MALMMEGGMEEKPGSQSHQAFLALESMIVTLKLKPGSFVTERQLIELTGQGRTPVREAIQKLSWQGLVAVRPRVGLQITSLQETDHAHVMATRRQLEPLAARLLAIHANAEDRDRLLACATSMMDCSATGDMAGFLTADKVFDEIMEAACPNRFLTHALAPLQSHSRRIWFSKASSDHMDRSIALHVKVITAIHAGDEDGAEKAMIQLMDYLSGN